jgi:hypothetical protein
LDTVIEMGFTPDLASCTPNCVSMVRNATKSAAGVLAIDIKANAITAGSVFGAAFDVNIQNTTVTQWNGSGVMTCTEVAPTSLGCTAGNFLEVQPPVDYLVNLSGGNNTLVVGAAEFAPATGVTGSGTIITLKFKKIGMQGAASTLSFAANSLNDLSANPIAGIWSAGTVTVAF